MIDKEILDKCFADEKFQRFCSNVDKLKEEKFEIENPIDTALLLYDVGVDFILGNDNLNTIHVLVKDFVNYSRDKISDTKFFDYFTITCIKNMAENNVKELGNRRYSIIPLDITEYANSVCEFVGCNCGYMPNIILKSIFGCLILYADCKKCNLHVLKYLIHDKIGFNPHKLYTVYENFQDGIKELAKRWNAEVTKNESVLHRTMRELLQYDSNCFVNELKLDMHNKLYNYMVDNNIYRKPQYWNEPGYWDIATDKMMECKEPVQWVEELLWENLPNRIV